MVLPNVLIDIPEQFSAWRVDDEKTTVVLNGTVGKKEFM